VLLYSMSALIIPTSIKDFLSYNPLTGVLTWKMAPSRKIKAGSVAGGVSKGVNPGGYARIQIQLGGKMYKAHRLAWFLHYGEQPPKKIDHINNDATDNRIDNLRDGTGLVNAQNMKDRVRKNGLPRYVEEQSGRYYGRVYRFGKTHRVKGGFECPHECHDACVSLLRTLIVGDSVQ